MSDTNMNFLKLINFTEVMYTIYQFLNFEEQLKLAQVCWQLKYFFTNYICHMDYTKIIIAKDAQAYFIKSDKNLNILKLNPREFAEFLKVYAYDIKELNEFCDPCLDIRQFPKLNSLAYNGITVTIDQIQNVMQYCKNLKSFSLNTCNNKDGDMLKLSRDLQIETILELKNLTTLNIVSSISLPLKYKDFFKLITKSKIKKLNLFYYIETDDSENDVYELSLSHLEELSISTTFYEEWYGKNFASYMKLFENLCILKLNDDYEFESNSIQNLANCCRNLKELYLNFTTFQNVNNFNVLNTLEILNLESCQGLTYLNLKEILTELNLHTFSCWQTDFEGEFEDFAISNKIQHLNIHDLETYRFKGAISNNRNLKSLVWYYDLYEATTEPFAITCPHLEHLTVDSGFIPLENVLDLKSLLTFAILYSSKDLCWSYITTLLKNHNSLQEFSLENLLFTQITAELAPSEAFVCQENLKSLKISPEVFEVAIDFWLDLLDKNSQLKLSCLGLFSDQLLRKIIESSKFPKAFRVIYVNGFKVACRDLRKNFDRTMEKINDDSHMPSSAFYETKWGIIF